MYSVHHWSIVLYQWTTANYIRKTVSWFIWLWSWKHCLVSKFYCVVWASHMKTFFLSYFSKQLWRHICSRTRCEYFLFTFIKQIINKQWLHILSSISKGILLCTFTAQRAIIIDPIIIWNICMNWSLFPWITQIWEPIGYTWAKGLNISRFSITLKFIYNIILLNGIVLSCVFESWIFRKTKFIFCRWFV